MNKDIKRLLSWFDQKTHHTFPSYEMAEEISLLKKVPPTMQKGLAAFKKHNKVARVKLALVQVEYWENKRIKEAGF